MIRIMDIYCKNLILTIRVIRMNSCIGVVSNNLYLIAVFEINISFLDSRFKALPSAD